MPENVKHVEVVAIGRTRIITPKGESWDDWFDEPVVSADFMNKHEQPADQVRR